MGESLPVSLQIQYLRRGSGLSSGDLAQLIGTSLASIERWERGDIAPGPAHSARIKALLEALRDGHSLKVAMGSTSSFASRGARRATPLPLFDEPVKVTLAKEPLPPILQRLRDGKFVGNSAAANSELFARHRDATQTATKAISVAMSAGKNTYTYDAHTYHTKVPPQGIAELIRHYLPQGGLVLDPFAGSGMTGVAALTVGCDVVLNELSPAASFIADRFTKAISPHLFAAGVQAIADEVSEVRTKLYNTTCRECGKRTETLFTVWSYRVICQHCEHEFLLWDHCRRYGKSVREHKILSEFNCPACNALLKKSRLKRTIAEPVLLGYKCCTNQIEHPLSTEDRVVIDAIDREPPLARGYFPTTKLPNGVNLRQPIHHGLDRLDKFYTNRNLAAVSHLWRAIHRVEDRDLAAFLAFVFTSLYQRVTKLSEFRFWGGSGNTARFNVPFIFNEANVFVTFLRKAGNIQDHLETTAATYAGGRSVICGSATDLTEVPDESIDFIFTDPPFGANINYSEMNILWESWLGAFTDTTHEAIVNRFQNKALAEYEGLMEQSLRECYRCLRSGRWMLLVFMNSSAAVWESLRRAILASGFRIERVDIFDKQHGTFKQFVSENTAGADLVLHCRKPERASVNEVPLTKQGATESVTSFVAKRDRLPVNVYLHVERRDEVDFRLLYSEWLSLALAKGDELIDFQSFRRLAGKLLEGSSPSPQHR